MDPDPSCSVCDVLFIILFFAVVLFFLDFLLSILRVIFYGFLL